MDRRAFSRYRLGMQSVGTSSPPSRYQRGVTRLDPEKVDAIESALRVKPTLSKTGLARRAGLSRATVSYYLRAMPGTLAGAGAVARERAADTYLDLLTHVSEAARAVREEIGRLATLPLHPATSGVVFRGFGTLERLLRLQAELLGDVSPPTTNVYLTRVEALLTAPVPQEALPKEVRAALDRRSAG